LTRSEQSLPRHGFGPEERSQRVMVMADGFDWNGQTYDSLSKVAFAITGTKWNGPRFFGLRDKERRSAPEPRP
jgi:hypothetical protein